MNTEKLREIAKPFKPVLNAILFVAGLFVFLFVGKFIFNAATEFVKSVRGFSRAFA